MKVQHFARALAVAVLAVFALAAQAGEATPPDRASWQPRYTFFPLVEPLSADALTSQAAAGATIPLWSASVASLGKTFKYTMVGQNPQIKLRNPATVVPLVIVPIKFVFANGDTFDPSAPDPTCSPAGTPLDLFLNSPIVKDVTLTSSGKKVVTGQYPDVFQFSNFYKFTGAKGGLNPHFSITLRPKVLATQTVTVSSSVGEVVNTGCGNKIGLISVSAWQSFIEGSLFAKLKASLTPTIIPYFLLYNVVMFESTPNNCCILGFHSAFLNRSHGNAFQTYGTGEYDATQAFTGVGDVSVTSHEIDELQDDPSGTNPTPPWGHVGQVSGCQSNLEVGDPLSGTFFSVPMPNHFTYHVQDLAFLSWFYRQSPSIGLGGLYSLLGTFKTSAGAVCH